MNGILWLLYVSDCFISVYLIIQVCVLTKKIKDFIIKMLDCLIFKPNLVKIWYEGWQFVAVVDLFQKVDARF